MLFLEQPTKYKSYENGFHYYIIRLEKMAIEAREYCVKTFPKGDLAEIDTVEKIMAINKLISIHYSHPRKLIIINL